MKINKQEGTLITVLEGLEWDSKILKLREIGYRAPGRVETLVFGAGDWRKGRRIREWEQVELNMLWANSPNSQIPFASDFKGVFGFESFLFCLAVGFPQFPDSQGGRERMGIGFSETMGKRKLGIGYCTGVIGLISSHLICLPGFGLGLWLLAE